MENHIAPETPVVVVLKFLIGMVAIFYMSTYLLGTEDSFVAPDDLVANATASNETQERITTEEKVTIPKSVELQPHCDVSYVKVILKNLLFDLYLKNEMCTPEDVNNAEKHRLPKVASRTKKMAEPKGTMVVYIAVGLLLTSLGAAFVEVFKAKQQPQAKSKPPLTRTCSLADLTVLRHNRKESMRRDSFMDSNDHRAPSKLLGPGDLGCATPYSGGFHGSRSVSRKASIDNDGMFFPEHRHTHFRLLHRH